MKKLKRMISMILLLCMIISMLPPVQPVSAAAEYQYILDTDGIDVGSQYLIVSGTGTQADALMMNPSATWRSSVAAVSVSGGNAIGSFSNENACLWTFSSSTNGTVSCNGYYLNVDQYVHYQTSPATMQFAHLGGGAYGIYVGGGSNNNLQYLYHDAAADETARFITKYQWGVSGTNPSAYAGYLYLFKKVEGNTGFSVEFLGNGNTAGQVPERITGLKEGDSFTIPEPSADFKKTVGNDTYLFWCWTEHEDGTGTEYKPGQTITVTKNTTFYAQWYLQIKYAVTVITDLDGIHTDIDEIMGEEVTLYILSDQEGSTLQKLERTEAGTYVAYVTENGTYSVYTQHGDEQPQEAHGHKVVIYNQSGSTELLNYSVSYDTNGGTLEQTPLTANYHANTPITAMEQIPTLAGNRFLGWKDQHGNMIAPGGVVTEALREPIVLTAQWEDLIDVTVNITVNHVPEGGGEDTHSDKYKASFILMQNQDGLYQPCGEEQYLDRTHESFQYENGVTTYTVKHTNLPLGDYSAGARKSHYEAQITKQTLENGDQIIHVVYTYAPDDFDLQFNVKVELGDLPKELRPQAVNLRVTCLEKDDAGQWTWRTVTQHETGTTPVTVFVDENGNGTGFFPVWTDRPNNGGNYVYRVRVSSFVMPDGTVVMAQNTTDDITYRPETSGLYTATVSVENGQTPEGTTLPGAYYDGQNQVGIPTVTVAVTPFTVTFNAGEGKLDGQTSLVLTNQYRYPDLSQYIPVPDEYDGRFTGWYVNGVKAENQVGQYLTGDITYVAEYNPHMTITGTVYASGTYEQDGQTVTIADSDRIKKVRVVLQKNINGVYNDVDSQLVNITYVGTQGTGEYTFDHLLDDGTAYRVYALLHNYEVDYDNNKDSVFGDKEYTVVFENSLAQVDLKLRLDPELYDQTGIVDASQIGVAFRPDSVKVQVLYRDLGDTLAYQVIAQHQTEIDGLEIPLEENGKGTGVQSVWKWHNNITLYEYQLDVVEFYGQVSGVFTPEGVEFNENLPFTVDYDMPAYYAETTGGASAPLKATLIPKNYKIIFDMNLGKETDAQIQGMDKYLIDNGDKDQYAYYHTWSFAKDFSAFPYREGYVFSHWESNHSGVVVTDGGNVHVGAELAEDITLKAIWVPLEGTDYTIRHLELNTDKVLRGAQVITGGLEGSSVKAAVAAQTIDGYVYAGAMVGGTYYDKSKNPELVLTSDPTKNLMVVYYLPDGSDGYTEQVESNLHLDKTAVLEDNGTYTITMETYTKDNPITTQILQNTPMDIVLVLDQSGSIIQSGYLDDLQMAVNNFLGLVAEHGRENEVDHRVAIVGYAGDEDEPPTSTDTSSHPVAGGTTSEWVNTGVFDSNGDFHPYPVTGFNYTPYTGTVNTDGIYYTYADGEYLLLTYHEKYRHLITEDEARLEKLKGQTVYGYVGGQFVELTRNTSGLWLYGDKQLYSMPEFFTFHENVWTHRKGLERRQVHAYMVDGVYVPSDGHEGLFTRKETREADPQLNVYHDALVPVSVGANGSGGVNPGLTKSTSHLGSNGGTFVQYGVEMANRVFAANPLDPQEGRIRIMVMFTDGMPGIGTFDENVANEAISQAYITKNDHDAYVYTVGLYSSNGVDETNDEGFFMNGVSSNYPNAKSLNDVRATENYDKVQGTTAINTGGPYYVEVDGVYYELSMQVRYSNWNYRYCWGYTGPSGRVDIVQNTYANRNPSISGGMLGGYQIYRKSSIGYQETPYSGYYSTTDSETDLQKYFAHIVEEITTKITKKIVLHDDTILRDIMGQGLVLTPGTVITAYKQAGTYDPASETITWSGVNEEVAKVEILDNSKDKLFSEKTTNVEYTLPDGTVVAKENVPYISVYNLTAENPTNPNGEVAYHPHTVDITGYDFDEWYISDKKLEGYKMVVTITRVEARDDVVWGRATDTNQAQSGLWLPADAQNNRELLLPFDQPSTIFVERAYVLDYGKEFELSGWYFDDEEEKKADAIHIDCNIQDGMNWFDEKAPTKENGGSYGNTNYGNVHVDGGNVHYQPTTTQWGGYDQFYVFGNTWRKTVLAQDANENGNLWNKVTVIPANNIYYEDSFITGSESGGVNGISGFAFTGEWTTDFTGGKKENAGLNQEKPEHLENQPYGDVHGWTDCLGDDIEYSDGSAHKTESMGARVSFQFTGTGVDVYTRTNDKTGIAMAILTPLDVDGEESVQSIAMDNLSKSGDYYQIPTLSFQDLSYGTYQVEIIVTRASSVATGELRYHYYLDGIRVYNPLGSVMNDADREVKDAYGKELNAVFTEIRDIMLKYDDFTPGLTDDGLTGAVFIDWIQDGQGSGDDKTGTGKPTYEVGTTFKTYGPKNEVYLAKGQAVVMKVDPKNTYYVGMKSIVPGMPATVNVSGLDRAEPKTITVSHTTDMYYEVTPMDGYLVIQNGSKDGALLALTKLRTTNMYASSTDSGIQTVAPTEAVSTMGLFELRLAGSMNPPETEPEEPEIQNPVQPEAPADTSIADRILERNKHLTERLFTAVRTWLEDGKGRAA